MLTSLLFLSKELSFRNTAATSASFKISGNTPLVIVSLKGLCKTLTLASELNFSIFGGESNSVSLNDTSSNLKLFPLVNLFLNRARFG